MSTKRRIPDNIPDFNAYINNTDDYQQAGGPPTNAVRLGLTAQNSSDWKAKRIAWVALYKKYIDPAQCTTAVKQNIQLAMKGFKAFAQPLIDIMAVSPAATADDANAFNFVLDRKKPSQSHTALTDKVVLDAKPIGGGDVAMKAKTSTDSSRASKPDGADSVQLAYAFGATPPANMDKGTTKDIFTKASFTLHAGTDNIGSKMYVYARWYNTKHPELAGPWTVMLTLTVL